jgi:hypothetical protein
VLSGEEIVSVDEYIASLGDEVLHRIYASAPAMRRFSVPRHEARKLLHHLADEGIDGASMFPGCDGIVKALRERRYYE